MSGVASFGLEPDKALEYFKNKGLNLTYDYDEMIGRAHHKAFTVAKVTRLDLLEDINEELYRSMKSGATFEEFKKNIVPTLQQKGWWGEKEITDPKTGVTKQVYIGSRRLRNIYNTNMRVAYSVGRHKQMSGFKKAVFWRYRSALLEKTRVSHADKHGLIKHRDDPWWSTNYPPNDWGCKCTVTAHTKSELGDEGWSVDESAHENIAGKDWAYDVGAGSQVAKLSKLDLDEKLSNLPKLKPNADYDKLSDKELLGQFYKKAGIKRGEMFLDPINDPMIIDDSLFLDKKTKNLKIKKQDRHLFLDYLPLVLSNPDEIYLESEEGKIKKNMFKYFEIEGESVAIMAVFRYFSDKTQGATLFYATHELERRRKMKLIYQREESK